MPQNVPLRPESMQPFEGGNHMKLHKLSAAMTALALAAGSFVCGITATAADGAGGYAWEKTDGYHMGTDSVTNSGGSTTVKFTNADEEGLDDEIITGAIAAISAANTLIIGGTSLVVYPAAGLIRYFKGQNLVLINKSKTSADSSADLCINDDIAMVLGEAVAAL